MFDVVVCNENIVNLGLFQRESAPRPTGRGALSRYKIWLAEALVLGATQSHRGGEADQSDRGEGGQNQRELCAARIGANAGVGKRDNRRRRTRLTGLARNRIRVRVRVRIWVRVRLRVRVRRWAEVTAIDA